MGAGKFKTDACEEMRGRKKKKAGIIEEVCMEVFEVFFFPVWKEDIKTPYALHTYLPRLDKSQIVSCNMYAK